LAPALFRKAKRKNITVMRALANNKWISHISPIQSAEELRDFIELWDGLTTVNLRQEIKDEIKWKWTRDGQYSAQSAYQIQFMGRRKKPAFNPIWKAHTEPKCKIFAWILLPHKILTANMIQFAPYASLLLKRPHISALAVRSPVMYGHN
jgi:hypothetical protein